MKEAKFCEYFTEEVTRRYDRRSLILDAKRKYKFLISNSPGACGALFKDQKPNVKRLPKKIAFSEKLLSGIENTIAKLELEIAMIESGSDQLLSEKSNIYKCSAGEQIAYNRKQSDILKKVVEQYRPLHQELSNYIDGIIKQWHMAPRDISGKDKTSQIQDKPDTAFAEDTGALLSGTDALEDEGKAENIENAEEETAEQQQTLQMWEALSIENHGNDKEAIEETRQTDWKSSPSKFRISYSVKKELSVKLKRCNVKVQMMQNPGALTSSNNCKHLGSMTMESDKNISEMSVDDETGKKLNVELKSQNGGPLALLSNMNCVGATNKKGSKRTLKLSPKREKNKKLGVNLKRRRLWNEKKSEEVREAAALNFLNNGMKDAIKECYFENNMIDLNTVISPLTTMDVNPEALYKLHHTRRAMVVEYLQSKDWLALDLLHALNVICK